MPTAMLQLWSTAVQFAQADPVAKGAGEAAKAAAEGASQAAPQGDGMMSNVMMLGIFALFWFMIFRPQQKRAKEHKGFLSTLKVGSKVVTNAGMFGKIKSMDDNEVKLEIAPKVTIRVLRSQIAGLEANAAEAVENVQAR